MAKPDTVAQYVAGLEDWRAEVVSALRDLVRETAPEAKESIKWSRPVYEVDGPLCYIKAFKDHVNLGFWRGMDLPDEKGVLVGTGEKMRHVRLAGPDDVREDVIRDLLRAAVALNRSGKEPANRTRRRS